MLRKKTGLWVWVALTILCTGCRTMGRGGSALSEQIQAAARDVSSYQLVGRIHNQLADEITTMPGFPNVSQNDMYNYLRTRVSASLTGDAQLPTAEQFQVVWGRYGGTSIKEVAQNLAAAGWIDGRSQSYLDELGLIINAAPDASSLQRSLSPFEERVLADSLLRQKEKLVILGASSTARSSSRYWQDAISNSDSPWQAMAEKKDGENGDRGNFWRWVVRCVGDVVGFLVGGAIGDVVDPGQGVPIRGDLSVNVGVGVVIATTISCSF